MVLSHKFLFRIKCWISNIGLVLKIWEKLTIFNSWVGESSILILLSCYILFKYSLSCISIFLKPVSSHNSLLGRGETSLNKLAKLLWYKYLFVYRPLADGENPLILYSGDGSRQTRQECKNENIFLKNSKNKWYQRVIGI